MTKSLKNIRLFSVLGDAELAALEATVHWSHFERGQELVSHLGTNDEVYCIADGAVRTTLYSHDGKEVVLRDIQAGHILGEFAAIDGKPRAATVVAITNGTVGQIRAKDFRAMLRAHPALMEALLIQTIGLVRHMTDKVFEVAALSVKARIHIELLRLSGNAQESGGNRAVIAPAPTHTEFANQIGSHREAVTRELSQLSKAGIVESSRGRIVILDIAALAQKSSQALGIDVAEFFPLFSSQAS